MDLKELEKEHAILYRKHNIIKKDGKHICSDCLLNAWDETFPEYCIGPTSKLDLGTITTTEELYNLTATLFHLHHKATIQLATKFNLDNKIILSMSPEEINKLILSLQQVLVQLEHK
jgi:hypothetical protein